LRDGVERARVDSAVATVSGKEFGEWIAEVITDEGGNHIFVAERDDKEVASTSGVEVVLPARTGMGARLRSERGWHVILLVCFLQLFDYGVLIRYLPIKDHGQFFIVSGVVKRVRHLADWRYVGKRDARGGAAKFFVVGKLYAVSHDDDHRRFSWG